MTDRGRAGILGSCLECLLFPSPHTASKLLTGSPGYTIHWMVTFPTLRPLLLKEGLSPQICRGTNIPWGCCEQKPSVGFQYCFSCSNRIRKMAYWETHSIFYCKAQRRHSSLKNLIDAHGSGRLPFNGIKRDALEMWQCGKTISPLHFSININRWIAILPSSECTCPLVRCFFLVLIFFPIAKISHPSITTC